MNQRIILSFICGLVIGIVLMFKFENSQVMPNTKESVLDSLKLANNELLKRNEQLTDSVSKLDTIRSKFVTKYRYLKQTTVLPCDTLIKKIVETCDTIIKVDSLEIDNLKAINLNYKRVIANDSIMLDEQQNQIKQLKKEVKRQRRKRIVATALGIVGTGIATYFLFVK